MKFAVIPPTPLLQRYAAPQDLHLCLAHLVLSDPEYARFYAERSALGNWVILDNSAYELSKSLKTEDILQAAQMIHPSEIVLPDVLRDAGGTIYAVKHFMEAFLKMPAWSDRPISLMVVPQGTDRDSWIKCMNELLCLEQANPSWLFSCIGIPVLASEWEDGRLELVKAVPKLRTIHLLGWSSHDIPEPVNIECVLPRRVRSIDSCKPICFGIGGIQVDREAILEATHIKHTEFDYPGRPEAYFSDYWESGCILDDCVKHNIAAFRSVVASQE